MYVNFVFGQILRFISLKLNYDILDSVLLKIATFFNAAKKPSFGNFVKY